MVTKFITISSLFVFLVTGAGLAEAGQRRGGGGGGSVGRAVPRSGGGVVAGPRVVARPVYRSYYYGPRFGFGFYAGYPYGYYPYGYYGYPYLYGYPYGGYYGYPYGYVGGGYGEYAYGGVRITDAPKDAQVYADGYYVGAVDDFNGTFQRLNLEPGAHHIEVVEQGGGERTAFDVNVRPGQTITYRVH